MRHSAKFRADRSNRCRKWPRSNRCHDMAVFDFSRLRPSSSWTVKSWRF